MHFDHLVDMPPIIKNDLIKMTCGKLIGSGIYRQVYEYKFNKDLVVKIETADTKFFANIQEYSVWQEVQGTEFAKYFAPCVAISENGLILLQKRTKPMKKYPKEIPAFFTDTKLQNYGMIKGQFCCHDYASHKLYKVGLTKKMIKADWWTISNERSAND